MVALGLRQLFDGKAFEEGSQTSSVPITGLAHPAANGLLHQFFLVVYE